jgi:hypothetical protein
MLSVIVAFDFELEQMDVKKTFLHGDMEEEIYMKQLEGFFVKGKKELNNHQGCGIQNLILICWDLASQEAKRITVCILN